MALKLSKRRYRQGNPCVSNLVVSPEPSMQAASFWRKQLYGLNLPDHPTWVTAVQSMSCVQNAGGIPIKNVQLFLVPFINYFSHFSTNSTSHILLERQGEGFRRKQENNLCSLRRDLYFKPFLIMLTSFSSGRKSCKAKTDFSVRVYILLLRVHCIIATLCFSTKRETIA